MITFDKKTKDRHSLIVANIISMGNVIRTILQKLCLLAILRRLRHTWFGEFLSIYRWKEIWIATSLPILMLGTPTAIIMTIFWAPPILRPIIFFGSLTLFCIGSVYGDPDRKR